MIEIWQIVIILLAIIGIVLTISALVNILKSEFKGNDKIVWVLVVLFFNLVGAILYFTIAKNKKYKVENLNNYEFNYCKKITY
ncbi:PLD nuclease N-terminal domain-containing protein [uncultured Lutibacter sp.]|uniref:PLD nuclease N-terminal domain-containing protein n=1 Tax=uncultured Lutibacter sp. TaxID=437739 RepID=UPI00262FCDB5|nr:PLD nuclease N-terminal domain-containing protein [uncultured Lutibacter sp.]